MARLRDRRSSRFVFAALLLAAFAAGALPARAQERAPLFWFQGTRLIFEHAVPQDGDLAVSTRDPGTARFLERLGAHVSYQPQQRYVVVTAQDRRTIVFTLGDPSYLIAGVRARALFAPFDEAGDAVLPLYALARALYVEPVADASGETVLQPRIGALDVRSDGARTIVTVRGAMPLLATAADAPERVQIAFTGQGASIAPSRGAPGSQVAGIDVAVNGSTRVPTTTLTLSGAPGTTHRIVPGGSPTTYAVLFEGGAVAQNPAVPPPPLPGASDPAQSPATPQPGTAIVAPIVAGRATVTDLTIAPGTDDTLGVRVALSGAVRYEWHRLLDHRWYIDFANTTLSGPGRDERPSFGSVQSVRVRQIGTTDAPAVRIALTMTGDQRVDLQPSDTGLAIAIANAPATETARTGAGATGGLPVAQSAATPDPPSSDVPWKFAPGNGSRIIVLDPGHGGADTGTAHNSLVEKDLTLDIARRLRTLLAAQGWTVRMTRDSDIDPVSSDNLAKMRADGLPNPDDRAYLQTRCDTANNVNARLFISIHINSAPFAGAKGTTFYWFKPQDAAFAQALERSVIPLAGTQDDGTRHENFYVVRHTTMPSVLVETAFVTNPDDVALLRSPAFLQNVAQGIANGVKAYAGAPGAQPLSMRQ